MPQIKGGAPEPGCLLNAITADVADCKEIFDRFNMQRSFSLKALDCFASALLYVYFAGRMTKAWASLARDIFLGVAIKKCNPILFYSFLTREEWQHVQASSKTLNYSATVSAALHICGKYW